MNLTLMSLGLIPQPERPKFPDGVVRTITDPHKHERDWSDFHKPSERRNWIVGWLAANGPATSAEICEYANSNIGVIGNDIRLLSKEKRIVCAGKIASPSGGYQKLWGANADQV